MNITVAFVAVLAVVIGGGHLLARREQRAGARLADEAGTHHSVWTLARVEASRMALHPAWLVTALLLTGLIAVVVLLFEEERTVPSHSVDPYLLLPVTVGGLGAIVSAHRNVTRSRRQGTDELFGTTPTAPRARTAAHLMASLAPVPIAAVLTALTLGVVLSSADVPQPAGAPGLAGMAGLVLLAVVGGGVVGVLLGRWWPFAAAPLLGIALLIWLNNAIDHLDPRLRWLRVAVEADFGGRYDIRPLGWHLAFIAGLVMLGAALALARHGLGRGLVAALGVSVAVVVGSGWVMTRTPSPDAVAQVVRHLEHPESFMRCETRGDVDYCVDPEVPGWIDEWHPAVEHVLGDVPAAHRPADVRVRMRPPLTSDDFLPAVAAALDPTLVWASDGAIHPSVELSEQDVDIEVAWQAAAMSVGLRPSLDAEHPTACVAGGEARMVLAHWLAGRASPTARRSVARKADHVRSEGLEAELVPMDFVPQWTDDPSAPGFVPTAGSVGYGRDITVADALLDDPRLDLTTVQANWSELTARGTPASRLVELAGIDLDLDRVTTPSRSDRTACP